MPVERYEWIVDLSFSGSSVDVGGTLSVRAQLDPGQIPLGAMTPYYLYIQNDDTGQTVARCQNFENYCGYDHFVPWSENADPNDAHFSAFVAREDGSDIASNVESESIDIKQKPLNVTISNSPASVAVGSTGNVYAKMTEPDVYLPLIHQYLNIRDDSSGQIVARCQNFDNDCGYGFTPGWDENADPQARSYSAFLSTYDPADRTSGIASTTIPVDRRVMHVTLRANPESVRPGDTGALVAQVMDGDFFTPLTPYYLYIRDDDNNEIVARCRNMNNNCGHSFEMSRNDPKNRHFSAFLDTESFTDRASDTDRVTVQPRFANGELGGGDLSGAGSGGCSRAHAGDPVHTGIGNFYETYNDLKIPGRGCPLDLSRTYNSAASGSRGAFGNGWSFSYGMSVAQESGSSTALVTQENGSEIGFVQTLNTYSAPPHVMATLTRNPDSTWTFIRNSRKSFTFDSSGRLIQEKDLNNYSTTIEYPDANTIIATDSAGRKITMTLTNGLIVSATDNSVPARSLTYRYDSAGNLVEATDVGGGVTRFAYDGKNRMVTVREPKYSGDTTTSPAPEVRNEYDDIDRVTAQTDQLGRVTTFDYNTTPGSTIVTDPAGNALVDKYVDGLRVSRTRAYGTPQAAKWTYEFDPSTHALTRSCDPLDHCTAKTNDARGNVLTSTDPLNRTTTYTYDSINNVTSITDPKGVKTTKAYDSAGNLLSVSRPLKDSAGATTATQSETFTYGGAYAGDLMARTDPNGKIWRYTYDSFGNQTSVTAPPTPENAAGNKTTRTFNTSTGWMLSETSPKGNLTGANATAFTTNYTYDAFGRPTSVTDPLWKSTSPNLHKTVSHYDANGNVDYEIDGNGNKTTYVYDAANQLTQTIRANGTSTRQDYWADGSLRREYNGLGDATEYQYDPLGNPASMTDPLGRATTVSFDAAGRLTKRIAPGGSCTVAPKANCANYTYDAANQMTGLSYADGLTPAVSNITYDAAGQRTAITDGTGTSAWTWDSLNRLTSTKDGYGSTVSYAYDLANNQTSLTYPSGSKVTRTFDAAGRNDSIQDWKSNKTTFAFDANSNLTTTRFPTSTGVIDTNTYDNADAVTSIAAKKGTTNLATFNYARNGADQVASSTTTGITESANAYAYNTLGQLTKS
ncbi:MAG: hypothetical protein JHD02_03120, partial [Thermoleophilaceae bacterium]|nr:hypothetical protein [Thermoleophilaceae bacterium]